ncbi:MAG: PspC domain-containing protein [candidate division Zixibacteria bacterium]|nr:PspC domain-containing protein [candidate division Zixibacteria bacterium]
MTPKKLYRSRENAMIGGVCAGLAEYFKIDASLARLAAVILIFPGGLSLWAYIVAWIVIPHKPLISDTAAASESSTDENVPVVADGESISEPEEGGDKSRFIVGIVLVGLGILFLLNTLNLFDFFSFYRMWPMVLIIVGLVVLFKGINRGKTDES